MGVASGILSSRDVAQPGRALAWGARGRQFKSARPDQFYCFRFLRSRFRPTRKHPSHRTDQAAIAGTDAKNLFSFPVK